MISLNLPSYNAKITRKNGKLYIYDPLRRKNVTLTPEEWVRQHFVNFIVTEKSYLPELIANEVSINVNSTAKRCDTIVYDNYLKPLIIIEYKAPEVTISEDVFEQISRYNSILKVPYLIVSNGITHYCCKIDYQTMNYSFMSDIPSYHDIKQKK